ncbi:MAG: response regulator receiver domain [Methylococcaceae bacterium]
MSKFVVAAQPIEYRDLIKEVYIDPIRTVVVIDDEFPSLDGLIAKELKEDGAWSGKEDDARKVKEILQYCRQKDKPWLVDVHDGKNIPFKKDEIIAPYLYHSNLMILDFHLADDGGKAIKILKKLAENNHFNMVIVYTKGDPQAGGDIETVVRDIALGLTYSDESLHFSVEKETDILSQITNWEDDDGEILNRLSSEITEQSYLKYRSNQENGCKYLLGEPEGKRILELFKNRPKSLKLKPIEIIQWLLWKKEKEIDAKLSKNDGLGQVTTAPLGIDINWIRTDRLFVTVVNKRHQPKELPEKLLDALNEWCPHPHRLLMSQMRFLMDDRGVIAESEVLGNRYIQVGWLKELLESKSQSQNQVVSNTITRNWEALGDVLRKDINDFSGRLVSHLTSQNTADVIKKYSKINVEFESKEITKHINCYNSTKPIDGFHLTTGHILELDSGNPEKEYWICLSPACDLVPGQKTSGLVGRVKDSMPFTAVQLTKIGERKAIEEANHNIYLFLKIDNEICTFSFHPNGQLHSNPVWEQLIAEKEGKFEAEGKELQIWRPGNYSRKRVTMKKFPARVVTQLQYEYALNLLQRFGATMSRVGLDFSKPN